MSGNEGLGTSSALEYLDRLWKDREGGYAQVW